MQIVIQQLRLGGSRSLSGSCWFQTWCSRTICYGVAETSITWGVRVFDNVEPADTGGVEILMQGARPLMYWAVRDTLCSTLWSDAIPSGDAASQKALNGVEFRIGGLTPILLASWQGRAQPSISCSPLPVPSASWHHTARSLTSL
jgi:hypothetical protein